MVRPLAIALAVVVMAGAAHASGAGNLRAMGLYPITSGAPAAALPMLESKVEVVVRGAIVEAVITQKFVNRGDRAIEATYIFPLPEDAAVTAMAMTIGTRTIRAAIEKRDDAKRRYEAAVAAGVAGAVLDQERPDVFTQTVAAIPAKGTVEVVLRFDALARYADGTWALAVPMVVAPRYVPGTASGRGTTGTGRAPDTDRAPDASRVTPSTGPKAGGPTSVAITFTEKVTDVTSPTHTLKPAGTAFTFVDPTSDRDAVIRWRTATPAAGWIEQVGDGGFAAVVVEAAPVAQKRSAARMVFVIDRAATMMGDGMVVAQPFVRSLFGALGASDRVFVVGTERAAWSPPADALKVIEQAWTKPGGPFDLTRVLLGTKPDGAPIVVVTDGLVADDVAAIAAAKKVGVPIHVIGVGAAPARGLLVQIAATTGGTVRFVMPADDLAAAAKALVNDVVQGPAPLSVNWGTLSVNDVVPAVLPRLGAGQAIVVLARVKRAQKANARARGELFALETITPPAKLDGAVTTQGPLARRWAKLRLDDLLVGKENVATVTKHALAYGLVSPYTSLVAIGEQVVVEGGVKHSVAVPVSVPAGMHWIEVKQETVVDSSPTTGAVYSLDAEKRNEDPAPEGKKNKPDTKSTVVDTTTSGPVPEPAPMDEDGAGGEAEEDGDNRPRAAMRESGSYDDAAEEIQAYETSAPLRRGLRFTTLLGGGVAFQAGDREPLIAMGLRVEAGRRNLFGFEASLVVVNGPDLQGRFLLSYARLGIARLLELGGGIGAHVGAGFGPALSLSLRGHLPPRPSIAGYLRYDASLLVQDDSEIEGQSSVTLGLEYGF